MVPEGVKDRLRDAADPESGAQSIRHVGGDRAANEDLAFRPRRQPPTRNDGPKSPYRFRKGLPHAEGGLGAVFHAEDLEVVGRRAAWKEIQAGKHADDEDSRAFDLSSSGTSRRSSSIPGSCLFTASASRGEMVDASTSCGSWTPAPFFRRFASTTKATRPERIGRCSQRRVVRSYCDTFTERLQHDRLRAQPWRASSRHQTCQHHGGRYGETIVVDWGLAKLTVWRCRVHCCMPSAAQERFDTILRSRKARLELDDRSPVLRDTPALSRPRESSTRSAQGAAIYSLGATLYHLLVGRAILVVISAPLRQVRRTRTSSPETLECAICLKAMSPEPADRYRDSSRARRRLSRKLADHRGRTIFKAERDKAEREARKFEAINEVLRRGGIFAQADPSHRNESAKPRSRLRRCSTASPDTAFGNRFHDQWPLKSEPRFAIRLA